MNGYWGKILRADLSTGEITVEEPPESFYRRYLGGSGLVGYYLLKEVPKGADPLGPENRLIFAAGPVTGVPIAGAGRNAMGAKSPLSGGYGEADVGGYFHWTAVDNYEWEHGFSDARFGLIGFDPESLERRPKRSARWLADLIERGSLDPTSIP